MFRFLQKKENKLNRIVPVKSRELFFGKPYIYSILDKRWTNIRERKVGKFRKNCRKNKSVKDVRIQRELKDEDIITVMIPFVNPLKERK